jgi:hypothetical protein
MTTPQVVDSERPRIMFSALQESPDCVEKTDEKEKVGDWSCVSDPSFSSLLSLTIDPPGSSNSYWLLLRQESNQTVQILRRGCQIELLGDIPQTTQPYATQPNS